VSEGFYRADEARSRADGGAGLGLAIARWCAEIHGGTLGAHSCLGSGSTFTVTLPLAPLAQSGEAAADADPSAKPLPGRSTQ